jgi:hypothetical protein
MLANQNIVACWLDSDIGCISYDGKGAVREVTHTIIYDKSISTFIIRIFGKTTEQDVINCFRDYDKIVSENFGNYKFNVMINVDEEAHSSMTVLGLIRSSLENQPKREYIANIVAINENPMTVAARNTNRSSNNLPFFINEDAAKKYLSDKMREKGNGGKT